MGSSIILHPCDIFFAHGEGIISKLIRVGETSLFESWSIVNHTGILVSSGKFEIADAVEALSRVRKHTLYHQYHNTSNKVEIFRPIGLTDEQQKLIVDKALSYVDKKYGYLKIVAHMMDYFIGEKYVFRRLVNSDNYPICSWLVAHAYKAADLNFGCDPGMANPDDIWDFCCKHPDKYEHIFDLQKI